MDLTTLWMVLAYACAALGFNVDIDSCVRHKGPHQGSMFGFAVQEHVEQGQKWVLVGAPEDDTRRPGITRAGAVYRCDINAENSCTEIVFDSQGNNNDTNYHQIDQKSNQWFGASLTSTGRDGPVVACAPRYVTYVSSRLNMREPVGTCFVAKNSFQDINEYSPCRTSNYGYDRTGVCQAGFGAAISKDGSRLFMGAPGSWYWQGQTFSIDPSVHHSNFYWPRQSEGGQLYSQSLESRPVMLATPEASQNYDDSYLGYSVAVGDFGGHGQQGVAVGMPRGSNLKGKVVMYTWKLDNIRNVSGSQIGAYFGYSVASGDIDGDGLDDLIVGAPMYTVPNNEGSFEQGRVYVIYQGRSDKRFKLNDYRTGEVSRGRFGLSLTSLGDINLDGFGDFAVGAPYGGVNGRGVVYIYYGMKDGVRDKYSQAITAEEVAPQMTTFGFSLSGGVDLDDNLYNDMVVGAYKSDTAVFFKSRPVVKVTAQVQLEKSESREISLDDTKCKLRSGQEVVCMEIKYCLQYDGINVDATTKFEIFLDLDSLQKKSKRLFLLEDEKSHTHHQTILINRQQTWCHNTKAYVSHEVRDKLTPIEVSLEYNLKTERYGPFGRRDYIPPVLDMTVGNTQKDSVNISKNCGPDHVCIPNLKMSVEPSVETYVLGSQEKLGISVFIENSGEDAFEASYYLHIPAGVHFVKSERLETGKTLATAVHCSTPVILDDGNTTLRCDIGNPLPSQQIVKFKVLLKPSDTGSMPDKFDFFMVTNSTNPEKEYNKKDNTYRLIIDVKADTNVSIVGLSVPPELHYNASQFLSENVTRDSEFGPQVIHAYNVKNNGPSFIQESEIFLIWPYQTLAGEDLFYMLVQPEFQGDIKCDVADHVNERRFYLERSHQEYLPQIIQELASGATGKASTVSGAQAFTSEEERRRIELEQQKYSTNGQTPPFTQPTVAGSTHRQGTYEQTQNTWMTNSGRGAHDRTGYRQDFENSQHGNTNYQQGGVYRQGNVNYNQQGNINREANINYNQQGNANREANINYNQQGNANREANINYNQQGNVNREANVNYNRQGNFNYNQQANNNFNAQGGQHGGYNQGVANTGTGGYTRYKEKNTTVTIDEQGRVSKTETSTEYGSLGHEGEAGSSWNNRQQGIYNNGAFEANSNSRHGGYNQSGTRGINRTYVGYDSSSGLNSGRHSWSTEESVNKDLFNAGSRTSVQGSSNFETDETVVGGEEESIIGLGAVAGNPNNEFRTVWTDVTGAETSGNAGSSGQSSSSDSSSRGVAYSGEARSGSGFAESGHAGGAAISSHGGSQSSHSSHQSYGGGASRSGSSSWQTSSRSGGSYSAESSGSYGSPANYQQWSHRSRRQAPVYDKDLELVLANCTNNFKCAMIRCTTGPLEKGGEGVWVSLRGRINAKFLNEMSKDREVLLTTVAGARVTKLPFLHPVDPTLTTFQAATHVTPQLEAPTSGSIPLWVVVLAACAGALLLLLLILALYKCGFFKRNRPADHAERQPLNRNGYGHGDEHL